MSDSVPRDLAQIVSLLDDRSETNFTTIETSEGQSVHLVALSSGRKIEVIEEILDKYRTAPRHLAEAATLDDVASLIGYLVRFQTEDSAIFARIDPAKPSITAVIDYHSAARRSDLGVVPAEPAFGRHVAGYQFPLSPEFAAWKKIATGDLVEQEELAWFLERRQHDIANPPVNWLLLPTDQIDRICHLLNLRDDHQPVDADGKPLGYDDFPVDPDDAGLPPGYRSRLDKLRGLRFGTQVQMVALSRQLSLHSDSKSAQTLDLQSGAATVVFEEDVTAKIGFAKVKIPDLFLIELPLFVSGERFLLPVRFYYRKVGAKIKFALELVDPDRLVREAVEATSRLVATATGLPLFFGGRGRS